MKSIDFTSLFFRDLPLDSRAVKADGRSIEVSFSSETPVPRWFGKEILLHGTENVDLSRLQTLGSALLNHDPDKILGKLENVRIENRRGKAQVVFDEDDLGDLALGKVKSGSLRGVSVGYVVDTFRELQAKEEWSGFVGPAHVATRWTPVELSLTVLPADSSVGVGRVLTRSLAGIKIMRGDFSMKKSDGDLVFELQGRIESLEGLFGVKLPELRAEVCELVLQGKTGDAGLKILDEGLRLSGLQPGGEGNVNVPLLRDVSEDEFIAGITGRAGSLSFQGHGERGTMGVYTPPFPGPSRQTSMGVSSSDQVSLDEFCQGIIRPSGLL